MKVSLLVDGYKIQKWILDALSYLEKEKDVSYNLLVVNIENKKVNRIEEIRRKGVWVLYKKAQREWREHITGKPKYKKRYDIRESSIEYNNVIECRPLGDGLWNELPDNVVNRLSESGVTIRFGFGLLRGKVLDAPTHGVLSYHHGDLTEYRGPPAGFWEYLDGRQEAGVTIQRLNDSIDGGEKVAFRSVDIRKARSLRDVRSRLFEASIEMLPEAIKNIKYKRTRQPSSLGKYNGWPGTIAIIKSLL